MTITLALCYHLRGIITEKKEDKIIKTIKEIRINLGLTQKEMGSRLGISRVSYWMKETGKRAFTAGELLTICKLANVNPLELSL